MQHLYVKLIFHDFYWQKDIQLKKYSISHGKKVFEIMQKLIIGWIKKNNTCTYKHWFRNMHILKRMLSLITFKIITCNQLCINMHFIYKLLQINFVVYTNWLTQKSFYKILMLVSVPWCKEYKYRIWPI